MLKFYFWTMFRFRQVSAVFFLTLFLSVNVLGLHGLTHEEDYNQNNNCELCSITASLNLDPFLFSETNTTFSKPLNFDSDNIKIKTAQLRYFQNNLVSHFLTRPPPAFL